MSVGEFGRSVRQHPRATVAAAIAMVGAVVAGASRLPGSVVVPGMILLLSAVDIIGAVAAKQWAQSPGIWVFLAGSALYILLFWLYAQSLRHGELTTVTVGWVAVLTVASMVLDRLYYGVHFAASKWGAAVLVVLLLGYLLTDSGSASDKSARNAQTAGIDGSRTELKTQ